MQEPTVAACQIGPLTTFTETLDVALINALPGTAYDFYAQPNGAGAPVKVATTTEGNTAVFARSPAVSSATAPTSVVVTAVLAGASPTPLYTLTASGRTLVAIDCATGRALRVALH